MFLAELGTSPVSVPTAEKPLTENTLVRPEVRWTSSGGDEDEVDMGPRSEEENGMVDYGDLDSQTSFTAFPPTYLVLRLSPNIQPAAVSWLVRKITGKKGEGGAELLVRCEPYGGRKKEVSSQHIPMKIRSIQLLTLSIFILQSLVLHVSASKLKFLELAEYMELKKVDCQGQLREFTVGDLDNFLHSDINLDNLLTAAEKQMIVIHELENLRSIAGESCVPGCPSLSIFVGQSIFQTFLTESLITSYYPLHDDAELTSLGDKWYWAFFQAQPFGNKY